MEARQSVRLCDALAGRELLAVDVPTPVVTELRETVTCGEASSMQLIREGKHALDVCLADIRIATDLCPSGSTESRQEVSSTIADAVVFASEAVSLQLEPTATGRGGATTWLALAVLFSAWIFRLIDLAKRRSTTRYVRAVQLKRTRKHQ